MSSSAPHAFDQTMAVEHGMNGALGGNFDLAGKAAKQFLPDLPRSPVRFIPLESQDGRLDLHRQLVSIPVGAPRAVGYPLQATLLVAVKDFVPRLTRNMELPAQRGH